MKICQDKDAAKISKEKSDACHRFVYDNECENEHTQKGGYDDGAVIIIGDANFNAVEALWGTVKLNDVDLVE